MAFRNVTVVVLLASAALAPARAADLSPLTRCWTSTFNHQLSGPVREQSRTAPSHMDFIALHDGNFRWQGEPKPGPANLTYTYCFRSISDQGGVLFADGKPIPMVRKAGGQRMAHGADVTTVRDGDVMEALYTRTGAVGGPDTSIEILHDAQKDTTRLTMLTRHKKDATLVMMTAPAIKTPVPAGGG